MAMRRNSMKKVREIIGLKQNIQVIQGLGTPFI